jgi:hypothetical protein
MAAWIFTQGSWRFELFKEEHRGMLIYPGRNQIPTNPADPAESAQGSIGWQGWENPEIPGAAIASSTGDFCYEVEGEANKAAPPVIGRDSHHARVTEDWAVGPTRQWVLGAVAMGWARVKLGRSEGESAQLASFLFSFIYIFCFPHYFSNSNLNPNLNSNLWQFHSQINSTIWTYLKRERNLFIYIFILHCTIFIPFLLHFHGFVFNLGFGCHGHIITLLLMLLLFFLSSINAQSNKLQHDAQVIYVFFCVNYPLITRVDHMWW